MKTNFTLYYYFFTNNTAESTSNGTVFLFEDEHIRQSLQTLFLRIAHLPVYVTSSPDDVRQLLHNRQIRLCITKHSNTRLASRALQIDMRLWPIPVEYPGAANHALRVAEHCRRMVVEISALDAGPFADVSFSADQQEELYYAALLHNIGIVLHGPPAGKAKLMQPLLSIDRNELSAAEQSEIKRFLDYEQHLLSLLPWGPQLKAVPSIANRHYETQDENDSGPAPLRARMIAVAKLFDALTAAEDTRCKPLAPEKAARILEIEGFAGRLDRDVVKLFIRTCLQQYVD